LDGEVSVIGVLDDAKWIVGQVKDRDGEWLTVVDNWGIA
jgi:hypothetical protein